MDLLNKVNFTKGWPSKSIVEEVLKPDSGVEVEAGLIGRRKHTNPDVWVLGITELHQEPFIFRNDYDDPDAGRSAHASDYAQVDFGGVQGISFQNPLEIETIQFVGTPAIGDRLYANSDGKLAVAEQANGTVVANEEVVLAVVTKAAYNVGACEYIRVVPITSKYLTAGA